MRILARILLLMVVVIAGGLAFAWFYRPGLDAYQAHRVPDQPAIPAGALTATWLGVTAVLLRDEQHAIFIDPFFTRPPGLLRLLGNAEIAPDEALIAQWLARLGVKQLDAVLVSHSHYDHAMDAGVVARLTGARLLGSASTLQIGRGAGLDAAHMQQVAPGVRVTLGSFGVTFLESRHAGATGGTPTGDITAPLKTPAHYLDYKLGGTYSIVIDHPQGRILHHGSAGFVPGALQGQRADIAFLGIALIDQLDPYLQQTVRAVGARRVIPTHWDDFTRPLDQPLQAFPVVVRLDKFFNQMARRHPDIQVQTLEPGVPVALFPAPGP